MNVTDSQSSDRAPLRRYESFLKTGAWAACLLVCTAIAVTTAVMPDDARFRTAPQTAPAAIAIMLLGAALATLAVVAPQPRKQRARAARAIALLAGGATVVALQYLLVRHLSYSLDWDPAPLLEYARATVENDEETLSAISDYFSTYPNNTFIAVVFSAWFRLLAPTGLVPLSALAIASVTHVDAAVLLVFSFARLHGNDSRTRIPILLASLVLLALSAWIFVPYSDTFALPYVAASFVLWARALKHDKTPAQVGLFLASGATIAVAYAFKPSNLVILVAILLSIPSIQVNARRMRWLRKSALAAILAGGFASAAIATGTISDAFSQSLDPQKAFTWHHYLLMGANEWNYGAYAEQDVLMSSEIPTIDERSATDLEMAKQRILERSVQDNLSFYAIKLQRLYSDGSFNALYEGSPPSDDRLWSRSPAALAEALRDLYYFNRPSSNPLRAVQGVIWTMVLCLAFGGVLLRRPSRMTTLQLALLLSVLGLTLFLVVFESRPRYLYVFLPAMLMLAALGLEQLHGDFAGFLGRRKEQDT